MAIFDYNSEESIGTVESVDTGTVVVHVENEEKLKALQVNQLVALRSSKVGQFLIGLVVKIMRKTSSEPIDPDMPDNGSIIENVMKVTLIGTHIDKLGTKPNVFKRTLETVPEINAECFVITGAKLTQFMQAISSLAAKNQNPLSMGKYTLDDEAEAWLDGNKFFQRHAVIVGSTGSGKSWAVARIIEQVVNLPSANALIFDIHGEYKKLADEIKTIEYLRIAGPSDEDVVNNVFLPYWLLTYEEMLAMMLDRSDNNAPNQARAFFEAVIKAKKSKLETEGKTEILSNFTIDSPLPYKLNDVLDELKQLDNEMVQGARTEKQGPLFSKLIRFIQRLETKITDRRLNFLFNSKDELQRYEWFENFGQKLMGFEKDAKGVKVIDFSEVPSDILPLIIGLVARIVFSIQQWTKKEKRHPIALFCDEAHLYISEKPASSVDESALKNFERIAKEGRKYGIGLVVVTQRPADVNRTVLSQSNNFIAMRLTNAEDQAVIKRLFPDSLGDFADLLPILDIGEALIVGDASLLPSRIKVAEPKVKPQSATIDFWDEWAKEKNENAIKEAIDSLRKQTKS
ncbi:MAG: ATPase [Candidatus Marinimicrobia bacterium CG08_land_8_20_14_0_20_45_22]|nr:MAG: ATPase [Candidatus Marinimicrobia bacterium CG08_land_8_20_14_0_20_45_22]